MQNLFKQFGKLKRTQHINSEGIGMGLLICKRLIEANNGEIEIHSDGPNLGCIVRFTAKVWTYALRPQALIAVSHYRR